MCREGVGVEGKKPSLGYEDNLYILPRYHFVAICHICHYGPGHTYIKYTIRSPSLSLSLPHTQSILSDAQQVWAESITIMITMRRLSHPTDNIVIDNHNDNGIPNIFYDFIVYSPDNSFGSFFSNHCSHFSYFILF